MRVDIYNSPPPLTIGKGDDTITLILKRFDDAERFAICDACGMGWSALARTIAPLIIAWKNVQDFQGNPLPLQAEEEKGAPLKSNFSAAVGALPFRFQVEIYSGILAFVGLRREAKALATTLLNQDDAELIDVDPTSGSGANTQTPASTG